MSGRICEVKPEEKRTCLYIGWSTLENLKVSSLHALLRKAFRSPGVLYNICLPKLGCASGSSSHLISSSHEFFNLAKGRHILVQKPQIEKRMPDSDSAGLETYKGDIFGKIFFLNLTKKCDGHCR